MQARYAICALLFCLLAFLPSVRAQITFFSSGGGNWNTGSAWGNAGNVEGVDYPGPSDIAVISPFSSITVTANQVVDSIAILQGPFFNGLLINSGVSLTVNNGISAGNSTGSLFFVLNGNARVTVGGDVVFGTGSISINMTAGASTFNIAGNFQNPSVASFSSSSTSTVNFNGTSAQEIPSSFSYNHITTNNSSASGVSLGGSIGSSNISGDFTVETGVFDVAGFSISGGAGNEFIVNSGAELRLSNSSGTFPSGFGSVSLQT